MSKPKSDSAEPAVAVAPLTPMLEALSAQGPHHEHADKLNLFGQFVGTWEVDVVNHLSDGTREAARGEWHFGWILQGRAVQDVWIAPSRTEQQQHDLAFYEYGTAVRVYDPKLDHWHVAWSGPIRSMQILFVARERGDEIVLEGAEAGAVLQWIFSEIKPRSFRWRSQIPTDGGGWRVIQEMSLRRRD